MRFKRHLNYEQGLRQLDIVPLVNIMLLLLIFILIILGFMGLPGIKVNLPGLMTSTALKSQNLEIVINREGAISYKAQQISLEQLKKLLLQLPLAKTAVLIKADKAVPLNSVMQVWQVCQELGLPLVNIATTKE
jgi:biopolymer transport protein ExbD